MTLSTISLSDMTKVAIGIDRPEDVVVSRSGRVFASDHHCAVAEIHPDGSFTRLGVKGGAPNGLNMDAQGRVLIANFGIYDGEPGPLERFDPQTGLRETLVADIGGRRLTSSNYPIVARNGAIYCTHSTFAPTWPEALDGRADGFVYRLCPDGRVDVLADGIPFANGCCLDAEEAYLYVNRTSTADVVRFPILPDGRLGPGEPYGPKLGPVLSGPVDPENPPGPEIMRHLGYTDGNGFDAEGNLWVTLPAANKIVAITPHREVVTIVHDVDHTILNHPTNIAWGGPDLRDLYVGSIRANYVVKARSPTPGLPLIHQR